MTLFLRVEDVLALAEEVVGSPVPVRDMGLIVAAVARPQASFGGVEAYPSIHLKAAALLQSLAGNHALIDGNKRLAFASTLFFYALNDMRVTLTHDEAFDLVIGVVTHQMGLESAAVVLEKGTTGH